MSKAKAAAKAPPPAPLTVISPELLFKIVCRRIWGDTYEVLADKFNCDKRVLTSEVKAVFDAWEACEAAGKPLYFEKLEGVLNAH